MPKIKMSISRNSHDEIKITIVDSSSRIEFVDAIFDLESFAKMVTGLSHVEADAEYRGLEFIGKTRIVENRSKVCPTENYNKTFLENWLTENAQEEGWIISTYLGSQNSITRVEGGTLLRYSVSKYVDLDPSTS